MKTKQNKHPHVRIEKTDCSCRRHCLCRYRSILSIKDTPKNIRVYDTSFLFRYPHALDNLSESDLIIIPQIVLLEMQHHENKDSNMAQYATELLARIEVLRIEGLLHITDCYNNLIPKTHNDNDQRIFCTGVALQQLSYPIKVILMSCDRKLGKKALRFGLCVLSEKGLVCPQVR